ncbi:hypothetical protein TYRP_000465 [Tyrophagus putrescentiae]|nr:hypothetical protein TYRP_000465 [Tyrophagus putrescentiae]
MQSSSIVAERSNELHSTTTGSEWSPISSDKRAAKVARATCDITPHSLQKVAAVVMYSGQQASALLTTTTRDML